MNLLHLLQQSAGQFVSGEELSEKLGITRTAVWKQINQLKRQGYTFEAVPRKGYRLLSKPERIVKEELQSRLKTHTLGRELIVFEKLESTQNIAQTEAQQGAAEGTLIIAEEQTLGRGRQGRSWHSPPGKGIWMSLLLRPQIPLQFTPQLTLLVSVAVCRAIRRMAEVEAVIKWPNDIFVGGKKVCGILLESNAEDERLLYVIAGIGISVNMEKQDYPELLREKATSLRIESGRQISREQLIVEVLAELETLYELYHEQGFGTIRSLWEALAMSLGQKVRATYGAGQQLEGIAEALDESGALLVRKSDGSITKIYSGDVEPSR
jgi:BirA family transcriptional regulator, biotin operon repressor / biotin---[acetyl-CoA-carboxylase] ligase